MKPRHKKLAWILGGLAGLSVVTALVLNALNSNIAFFFSPSEVYSGVAPHDRSFRVGGLVEAGSVKRVGDGLTVRFAVTDTAKTVAVDYHGILPDLFKEGKGVVAQGKLGSDGIFHADQVLAKHDENYMPPEAAKALAQAQGIKHGQSSLRNP